MIIYHFSLFSADLIFFTSFIAPMKFKRVVFLSALEHLFWVGFFSRITDWPNPDWCLHTYLWKFRYIIMSPLHLDLFYQIANAKRVLPGLELCYLQVDIKQVDERGLRMWFEPVTSKAKHKTCGLKWYWTYADFKL